MRDKRYEIKKILGFCDLCAASGETSDKKIAQITIHTSQQIISLDICKEHAKKIMEVF